MYGTASAAPRRRRTCTRRAAPGSDGEGSARRSGWFRSIRMEVKPAAPEARVRPDLALAGADGAAAMARRPRPPAARRPGTGAARGRPGASGQGWGRSGRGRLVEPNVGPRRRRVRRPKPAARATDWVVDELRPRASRDDLQSEGLAVARRPVQPARKSCRPVPPIAARR